MHRHETYFRLGLLILLLAATPACREPNRSPPSPAENESDRAGSPGSLDKPAERVEWHRVELRGRSAGYLQVSVLPRDPEGYSTRTIMKLSLKRGTERLNLEALEQVDEDANGKVVGFLVEQKLSEQEVQIKGSVRGRKLLLETTVEGQDSARQSEVEFDPRAVGPLRAESLTKQRLRKEGDSIQLTVFVPQLQKCGQQTATLGPLEPTELPGGARELRRVRMETDLLAGMPTTEWVDEDFEVQKSLTPMMGMELITYRSTREEILAADLGSPPEIFFSSAILVDRRVPPGSSRVVYRLQRKKGGAPPEFPAAAGQNVVRREGAAVVLEIKKVTPRSAVRRPVEADVDLLPYLAANAYVQSDDDLIQKLSREIIGDESDAWEAARRLEGWVHANITEKNLQTGFATALEVARRLEGDCTEHAVLLAALARASGIPSRVVAGLVYHGQSFVGHMWTEVHCGEWIPLDATRGRGEVGADHIGLSVSSLDQQSVSELFIGLASVLGTLRIEVLEVN